MGLISEFFDDITGKTAADRQKENYMNVGRATASAYEQMAKAQEAGYADYEPWLQQALAQTQGDLAQKLGLYDTSAGAAEGALRSSVAEALRAIQEQDARKLGLVREGIGMDRATLSSMLERTLAAQSPYAATFQKLIDTALPTLTSGVVPLSEMAKIRQEDTARMDRAALQRQGLEGSGMAAARAAAANRRIAAEDEQSQIARAMQMLQMGLGGSNLQSGILERYASMMGGLGGRLSNVPIGDASGLQAGLGERLAQIYGTTAQQKAGAISQANLPQAYAQMGQFYAGKRTDPAATRLQGTLGNVQAQGQAGAVQAPTFLQTLGDVVKLYGAFSGMGGGGGGSYGYFGSPGSWSSSAYANGYRGVGPLRQ